MPPPPRTNLSVALFFGALLALNACKSEPPKEPAPAATTPVPKAPLIPPVPEVAELSNEYTISAEVTTIRRPERLVTLMREDGTLLVVRATEQVRNFDQIEVGDTLRVHYKESLKASKSARTTPSGSKASLAAMRAPEGANPSAGLGVSTRVVVKVESIDLSTNVVVFSLESGELVARPVKRPEGQAFLKTLKPGDLVQLVYTESMAMALEKQ